MELSTNARSSVADAAKDAAGAVMFASPAGAVSAIGDT